MLSLNQVIQLYTQFPEMERERFFDSHFLVLDIPSDNHASPFDETFSFVARDMLTTDEIKTTPTGKFAAPLNERMFWPIGRSEECAIILPDASVSRKHASVTCSPQTGEYLITDLNSTNGMELNGEAVVPMTPTALNDRDWMSFGGVICKYFHGPTFEGVIKTVVARMQASG